MPRGFAITNLQAANEGELSIWSTERLGSIQIVDFSDYATARGVARRRRLAHSTAVDYAPTTSTWSGAGRLDRRGVIPPTYGLLRQATRTVEHAKTGRADHEDRPYG